MLNLNLTPPSGMVRIPGGVAGVKGTLQIMRAVTKAALNRTPVRQLAVQLVSDLPGKDYGAEIQTLHAFVRDAIRYVKDIRNVETVQTPERTLANRAGDCDDKAILLAALLEAIGHHARFTAVGFRRGYYS